MPELKTFISKRQLELLHEKLLAGDYQDWAEGYIDDTYAENSSIAEMEARDVICIVKDFVRCRIIELEEVKK